jgi:phosphohistidine swiveling domain-containing protein
LRPRSSPPPMVLAAIEDGRRWTLDVAHNPDPLSTAQAGLVERVERAGAAPWSARVCAGYLYTRARELPAVQPARDADELRRRYAAIEERFADVLQVDGPEPASLELVLDRYVEFVRIWAWELGPLISQARVAYPMQAGDRPSAIEATLEQVVRGTIDFQELASRLGILSPAWDVAVPTFGERPGFLHDAVERARTSLGVRASRVEPADEHDRLAMLAADLAELDDQWFARAQWSVRRAILSRADELGISTEDTFWVPLDDLILGVDPVDASRRASGARAAAARASSWNMPIVVGSATTESGVALRGIGFGPKVTGRVRRFDSLASAIVVGRGDIVVTRAVTPALAVIVVGCAAIVSETGGLLDHGAAMARELGIPCVVGCRDAWSRLADGMIVTVEDGAVVPTASDLNVSY